MTLAKNLLHHLDNPNLSHDERTMIRCQAAAELEHRGQYETAREVLGELWRGIGKLPIIEGLNARARAEVLLCIGTLSGSLGSVNQVEHAQEKAKDLISKSITLFESLGDNARAAAAQSALGVCYWRAGAHNEARVFLEQAFLRIDEKTDIEEKAKALIRRTLVEISTNRFHDAFRLLTDAAPIFEKSNNHALRGRFHGQFALVLRRLGTGERLQGCIDRAIVEYTAAIYHFERSGHTSYCARAENDLAFLLYSVERYEEAYEHLDYARRLFVQLKDNGSVAQVDETRTRVLLTQGRVEEAEIVISESVQTLEKGDEQSLLAESLTTRGVVLARLGRINESYDALRRAMEVAEQAGAMEDAGLAGLTLLEEHGERLGQGEWREIYLQADERLKGTQDASHVARLRECARWVMVASGDAEIEVGRTEDSRGEGKGEEEVAETVRGGEGLAVFVCEDEGMKELVEVAGQFAGTGLPLLISGEIGVGKEALARAIHVWSGRAGAFVMFDCRRVDEEGVGSGLLEQGGGGLEGRGGLEGGEGLKNRDSLRDGGSLRRVESFKDERGLSEGVREYSGAVREAEGGTLFVDEVAELDAVSQGKLLRLLERGEVVPDGGATPERVDVRVIASTKSNLAQLVGLGKFRQDLFYRFEAFEIKIPALRKRPDDIEALAKHFVAEIGAREKRAVSLSEGSGEVLRKLLLRGNARELRTVLERAVLLSKSKVVSEETLEMSLRHTTTSGRATAADPWAGFSLPEEMRRYEEQFIERALKDAHGSVTHAARLLGLRHHQSLSSLINLKHPRLLEMRTPVKPRRRSIIKK